MLTKAVNILGEFCKSAAFPQQDFLGVGEILRASAPRLLIQLLITPSHLCSSEYSLEKHSQG